MVAEDASDECGCPVDECGSTFSSQRGVWTHIGLSHSDETKTELLIDEIQRLYHELDRIPTARDMLREGCTTDTTVSSHFGSWNEALEAAGLEANPCFSDDDFVDYAQERGVIKRISDEELINEIHRLSEMFQGTPTLSDVREHGNFAQRTYELRFGSWNEAVIEAGYEPNLVFDGETSNNYYGPNWTEYREPVLDRDDHQCRCCGATAENEYYDTLPVHHITPARKYGADDPDVETDYEEMNDPSNLITLCSSCHRTFEGKWQDCSPDEFARRARLARQPRQSTTIVDASIASD